MSFRLLHQDARLIAVDKPSGMLVHRGMGRDAITLADLVRDELKQPVFAAHRLDRPTSGVVLFSLDADTARAVQAQFEQGLVQKKYWAIVRGVMPKEIVVDHPVPKSEGGERVAAQTSFERLYEGDGFSVVIATPHTGRFHQIRRHVRHLSHPIFGDTNYGKSSENRAFRERCGLARLGLHALSLSITHPATNAPITFHAPLADDLRDALVNLNAPDYAFV